MPVTQAFQNDPDYTALCCGRSADPYAVYRRLRDEDPVHWSEGFNGFLLTRHADVYSALRDPRLPSGGRLASYMDQLPLTVQQEVQPLREHYATWLVNLDPPDHTRLRTLVSKAFTPRVVEGLRGYIEQTSHALMDTARSTGQIEFVGQFAQALPAKVISKMLGVPPQDSPQFERWSQVISDFTGTGRPRPEMALAAQQAVNAMSQFVKQLTDQRRRQPCDDLLSGLVSVEERGDKLSEHELVGMCVFLLVAGHETTMCLLSNGLLALLQFPEQMQRLRDQPEWMPAAVEEFLRYDSPLQHQVRTAREDLEISGTRIQQGQRVVLLLGAANRDPEQFHEPDRLDIGRTPNHHLAFGLGIHYCIGAPLARLEAQVAFKVLLQRVPNLRLLDPDVRWREHTSMRHPRQLHLALS